MLFTPLWTPPSISQPFYDFYSFSRSSSLLRRCGAASQIARPTVRHDEEMVLEGPCSLGVDELDVVVAEQRRHALGDLEMGEMSAGTDVVAGSELR